MAYVKPSGFTRHVVNPVVSKLRTGGVVQLTVKGRRTGRPQHVPVIPVQVGRSRYLVAPFGESDWVQNLRAAGEGELRGRGEPEGFLAREIPADERAQVIAAYQEIAGRSVKRCFRALPDPHDHPVFEVQPLGATQR